MKEQETIDDIIAEMRFHGQQNIDAEKNRPEFGILTAEGRITQNYADRLDAELKHERGDCTKLRDAAKDVARQLRALAAQGDRGSKYGARPYRLRALAARLEGGAK